MEDTLWAYNPDLVSVTVTGVLILILMEDTLWEIADTADAGSGDVLILILMEDTLWVNLLCRKVEKDTVLILILMEDTLWENDVNQFSMDSFAS